MGTLDTIGWSHFLRPTEWHEFWRRGWRYLTRGQIRVSRTTVKVSSEVFTPYVLKKLSPASRFRHRASWKREFVRVLSGWHRGEISHGSATKSLEKLVAAIEPRTATWEDLAHAARFAMAVGLFRASFRFQERSWTAIDLKAKHQRSSAFRIALLKQFIYRGRVTEAAKILQELESENLPRKLGVSIQKIDWYISQSLGQRQADPGIDLKEPVGREWQEAVCDREVLIVGPGEISELPGLSAGYLVARIIGPGVYKWDDPDDIVGNQTDAVYSIPDNFDTESGSGNPDFLSTLQSYSFVNIKKSDVLRVSNSRPVQTFSPLFSFGHPQMVPLAILDVLANSGRPVVVGSDFFQSPSSYRLSDRRKPKGKLQQSSGSDGGDFDRSALMASHNILENWSIIKNLFDSGLVRGDEKFMHSLSCSHEALFSRYDDVMGMHRI